jgi:hypothetical protein
MKYTTKLFLELKYTTKLFLELKYTTKLYLENYTYYIIFKSLIAFHTMTII